MPGHCRRAVEHGLNLGNDPARMRLRALTEEIKDPNAGVLDNFLCPHLVSVDAAVPWIQQLDDMIGLVGGVGSVEATETYDENDPVGQAEYMAFVAVRDGPDNSETLDP